MTHPDMHTHGFQPFKSTAGLPITGRHSPARSMNGFGQRAHPRPAGPHEMDRAARDEIPQG
jgi:hypothetical protein